MSDFGALVDQARRVRAHAIRMATNGGCFLGASLSCADLLVYLYDRVLRVSPDVRMIAYGLLLIVIVFACPQGILPLILRRAKRRPKAEVESHVL